LSLNLEGIVDSKTTLLLINTPTLDYSNSHKSEGATRIPPFGLGYLATVASQVVSRNSIRLLDAENEELSITEIVSYVQTIDPKYICLNVTSPNIHLVKDLVSVLRGQSIIIGGPHVTLTGSSILEESAFEEAVLFASFGAGEPALVKFLSGTPLPKIPNIAFYDNDNIIETANSCVPIEEYVDMLLDRSFFKNEQVLDGKKKESYILASRGCPYRCAFCAAPQLINKYYRRSDSSLKEELRQLTTRGDNYIRFVDDLFIKSEDRVRQLYLIWQDLKLDKYNFSFEATGRSNIMVKFQKSTWQKLIDMGLKEIEIGIESGSASILQAMNKRSSTDNVIAVVKKAVKYGINVKGFIMVGYKNETAADLQLTVNLVHELKKIAGKSIRFSPVVAKAYPGTELYDSFNHINLDEKEGVVDLTEYTDFESPQVFKILKQRTRYNAVHMKVGFPITLSELSGAARSHEVFNALAQIVLVSEGIYNL
jgi:radical SAM superfamily enzyme YgiQ (UPF0313 family)